MITIEQLNAIRNEMAPKLAMRHGHGHFVDAGDGIRKTGSSAAVQAVPHPRP